ncbi:MAG: sigma factor-like helix-turn-helix DNA-binding protein [Oscillospiraceae bacterium]
MEIKEFLKQAYWIDRQINLDIEKVKSMRASLYGRTADSTSGGSSSGGKNNHVEEAICRVVDYEKMIDKEVDDLIKKKLEIAEAINSVPFPEREVLERRYLMFQKWETIASAMGFTKRRVVQIHGNALQKISFYFPIEV